MAFLDQLNEAGDLLKAGPGLYKVKGVPASPAASGVLLGSQASQGGLSNLQGGDAGGGLSGAFGGAAGGFGEQGVGSDLLLDGGLGGGGAGAGGWGQQRRQVGGARAPGAPPLRGRFNAQAFLQEGEDNQYGWGGGGGGGGGAGGGSQGTVNHLGTPFF